MGLDKVPVGCDQGSARVPVLGATWVPIWDCDNFAKHRFFKFRRFVFTKPSFLQARGSNMDPETDNTNIGKRVSLQDVCLMIWADFWGYLGTNNRS